MNGIRAEITVESPPDCPAASASASAGAPASSVAKSVPADPSEPVTEEFVVDAAAEGSTGNDAPDDFGESLSEDDDLAEVFSYGSERVYRFERPQGQTCFCECIEQFGCPVRDVHARDGALTVSFHAPDADTLRSVVSRLEERWSGVTVDRLLRASDDGGSEELVLIDRGELTDRQREVLETAHEMGYFEYPKGANAGEVADALDIAASTFTQHLAAGQRKLLSSILS
ncbi:helix-turn-helix domain-containing protein [Halobellus rufus]|uniref:helix-turn-helix domain-containing protein n=1 Tax=Halobellus rufus TaxID=1448860 RepID=UPI000679D423|nr:helix-turn-helix domain-containing protein [Halobellus rufus]